MGTSLTLFRVFDIDVRVHWSFVLALAYGAFMGASGPGGLLVGAIYGMILVILLFLCVTLHEFGHALTARYYKVKVSHILLLPIGGVANLERMPDRPIQEFLITLAGPLVNFVLAALLFPLAALTSMMEVRAGTMPADLGRIMNNMQAPGVANAVATLFVANLALGLFNLLPAFPMDGGRILRSLLAMALPYRQATRIAVIVGRLMAVIFAFMGIFGGGISLLLIAFFVYVGGSAELETIESRAVLGNVKASEALTANAAKLYASERLSRAVDLIMSSYQTDYPVFDLSGTFIGVLTKPRLVQALQQSGPETRIVDVMIPADQVPVTPPTATLSEVWEKMAQHGLRVAAVKRSNEFLGLLTLEDITEVFQVVGASMSNGSPKTDATPPTVTQQPADA